jgi:hypothetical protein
MLRALQQCAHVAFSGDAPGAKCHNRIQRCPFALIVCQLAIGFADHTGLHDRIQGLASLDAPAAYRRGFVTMWARVFSHPSMTTISGGSGDNLSIIRQKRVIRLGRRQPAPITPNYVAWHSMQDPI